MDRSLDDLVRFLLEQIALRGEIGALPADILSFLEQYHAEDQRQLSFSPPTGHRHCSDRLDHKLDRRYQEQVWKWLTRHPEIQVGRHGEGNRMSLAELEAHNEKIREARIRNEKEHTTTAGGDSALLRQPANLHGGISGGQLKNKSNSASSPLAQPVLDRLRCVGLPSSKSSLLHIFTSTERMWYAAAGHEPDSERVPSKEFVCLSIIASHGANGILQPDLVRISGQDKRSVPMRTHNLHNKGYIVKKPVIAKGYRTSLCTLKRFTLQHSSSSSHDNEIPDSQISSSGGHAEPYAMRQSMYGHVEAQIHQVFELLRELKLITWTDLKKKVGVYKQHSPSRWLARSMRKLEDLGYIQRVRAQGNVRLPQRNLHRCIQLIREPSPEEWQAFFELTSDPSKLQELNDQDDETSGDDNEESLEDDSQVEKSSRGAFHGGGTLKRGVIKPVQHPLSWTPDRPLINVLHDAVQASGIKGVTSADLKDNVVGMFFNRSLDHQIGRLVELWQASQPLHLRHLAILRDTTISQKMISYLYYTYNHFKSLVDAGSASWEAVKTIHPDKDKTEDSNLSVDATPDLDEYGFPRVDPSRFHGRNNEATLAQCAAASCGKSSRLTKRDHLVTQIDGAQNVGKNIGFGMFATSAPRECFNVANLSESADNQVPEASQLAQATKGSKRMPTTPGILHRGRPPKHFKSNLPGKQNDLNLKNKGLTAKATQRSREYQRKKAEKEVTELVEVGKNESRVRVYILKKYIPVLDARGVAAATATALEALATFESPIMPEDLPNSPFATTDLPVGQFMDVMALWADIFATTESTPGRRSGKQTGRPKKTVSQIGYFPSILAHTLSLPSRLSGQTAKRRMGSKPRKLISALGYLPSIAAHTFPLVVIEPGQPQSEVILSLPISGDQHVNVTKTPSVVNPRKRSADSPIASLSQSPAKRRGRVAKDISSQLSSLLSRNFDITQHSNPFTANKIDDQIHPTNETGSEQPTLTQSSRLEKPVRVRKKSAKAMDGEVLDHTMDLFSSHAVQSHSRPYLTYAEQLQTVGRPQTGVFIGPLADLKTKLHRGRARKSRMMVFKSSNLKNLAWFHAGAFPSCKEKAISDINTSQDGMAVTIQSTTRDTLERSTARSRFETQENPETANSGFMRDVTQCPMDRDSVNNPTGKQLSWAEAQRQVPSEETFTHSSQSPTTTLLRHELAAALQTQDPTAKDVGLATPNAYTFNVAPTQFFPEIGLQEAVTDTGNSDAASNVINIQVVHSAKTQTSQVDESPTDREDVLPNAPRPHAEAIAAATSTRSYRSTTIEVPPPDDGIPHNSDDDLPEVQVHVDEALEAQEKNNQPRKITKIKSNGGSVAAMRRTIILEIVEKSGGVYPGDREIHQPFSKFWASRTGSGRPDYRTIQAALKSLIDSTRLRKLRFTFQNKLGVAITKSIITVRSVEPTDPKVRNMQRKIIEYDPQPYIPSEGNPTSSLAQNFVQSQKPVASASSTREHKEGLRIIEDTVQLQILPKHILNRTRGRHWEQRQRRNELLRGQLEEGLGDPDFAVDGFQSSRVTTASDATGTPKFPLRPGAASVNGMIPTTEVSEPMPKRRRLATPNGGRTVGSMTRMVQPKGRLMKLIRKVDPVPDKSLDDVFWTTRSAKMLHIHNTEHTAIHSNGRPEIRFTEALGIHSNLDRTPSPDPENIQWEEDQLMLMDQGLDEMGPPGSGRTIGSQQGDGNIIGPRPGRALPKMRRSRRRSIEQQLRAIMKKYQESTPVSRLYRRSAKVREKPGQKDSSRCVLNADSARWQMLSLLDPEHTFHLPSGTFAVGFASQYIPPKRRPVPAKKQPKHAIASAEQHMSKLMNPEYKFHAPSGTFSVEFAAIRESVSVEGYVQPSEEHLPDDLEDLLSRPCNPQWVVRRGDCDNLEHPVLQQVDRVMMWEMATPGLINTKSNTWRFINLRGHDTFEQAPNDDWNPVFGDEQRAQRREEKSRQRKEKLQEQLLRKKSLQQSSPNVIPAKRKHTAPRFTTRQLMSSKPDVALTSKLLKGNRRVDADGRPLKRVRLRGPLQAAILGPDGDRRIMFAVMIVRTLTGGLEQNIDWVLLTYIFGFEVPERFIHQRWARLQQKHKLVIDKLQFDFQDMFLQAYEAGTVPPLDYEKLEDYDWNGLIDWASQSIQAPTRSSIPELPASRRELNDLCEFREVDEKDISEFFEDDNAAAIPRRQAAIHRYSYTVPLRACAPCQDEIETASIARSWVRANVLTPDETYNSDHARRKLSSIGDDNVESVVRDLLSLKVIMQENKGRLAPGRNYDISEHFLSRFRKKIDLQRFRQAGSYKKLLDRLFAANCPVDYSWNAPDGEVLAVLNLAAHGRIRMVAKNPPKKAFGLHEKGLYKTRNIAKELFRFTVGLERTTSYVEGTPLAPLPPPPGPVSTPSHGLLNPLIDPGVMDGDPTLDLARLPAWIDINNDLVPLMWELSLAAILSIMAMRPGVSAKDIERYLRPSLEVWEVESVMQWCVQAGVGTWTCGSGGEEKRGTVRLAEWWWLGLGGRS